MILAFQEVNDFSRNYETILSSSKRALNLDSGTIHLLNSTLAYISTNIAHYDSQVFSYALTCLSRVLFIAKSQTGLPPLEIQRFIDACLPDITEQTLQLLSVEEADQQTSNHLLTQFIGLYRSLHAYQSHLPDSTLLDQLHTGILRQLT